MTTAITRAGNAAGVMQIADGPKFSDISKGEEVVDFDYVDIGKLQMFFFTIAVLVGYAGALAGSDITQSPAGLILDEKYDVYFPLLSTAILTLLAISHTGYWTIKASPSTPTE